jgi:sugar diacid utilization regulator
VSDDERGMRRKRRALVDDLVAGTDRESVIGRAQELGHDLHQPHRVVASQYRSGEADAALSGAVERAADALQLGRLLSRRAGAVILVAQLRAVTAQAGRGRGCTPK